MHARTVTFTLPPDQLETALAGIRQGSQPMKNEPGFVSSHWLYDRERATLTAVVLFESPEAAAASWQRLGPATQERWRAAGVTPDVRDQEVVHSV